MNPKLRDWVIFSALGLTWGSSFLWIKIAVQETAPLTVVGLRLLFGWLGMLGVVLWRRTPLPRDRVTLLRLSVLGLLQTALPFALITWGETRIDSGLASILNGSMPLFTMVIAHLALHDEKITLPRLGGLTAGFVGVVVLVSRDLNPQGPGGGILGQLAVLAASLSYAVAVVYSRGRLRNLPPIVQSFGVLTVAEALVWASALTFTRPIRLPAHALTWLAVAWLGLLGSCLAYIMFFHLINAWGPTRASLVTYVFPVVGLLLGILFLRERADWRLLLGSALVVSGILVANRRPKAAPLPAPAASD